MTEQEQEQFRAYEEYFREQNFDSESDNDSGVDEEGDDNQEEEPKSNKRKIYEAFEVPDEELPKRRKPTRRRGATKLTKKKKARQSKQKVLNSPVLNGPTNIKSTCNLLNPPEHVLELYDDEDDEDYKPKHEPEKIEEDVVTLTVCTWNMQKFCESSMKLDDKIAIMLKIMDLYHPDFFIIEEVTDSDLLEESALETAVIQNKTLEYCLGREYKMSASPLFQAKSYKERYVLFYNTATVDGDPSLTVLKPHGTKLKEVDEDDIVQFSTKQKIPRPMPVWTCDVPVLRGDRGFIQKIMVGGIHTSPSYVNSQATGFVAAASEVNKDDSPFIMSGDWYIQNGAKRLWRKLESEEGDWKLVAPEKMTNFKVAKRNTKNIRKGQLLGQIADHHVVSQHFHTETQPLTISSLPMYSREEHDEDAHTKEQLAKLLDIDVDHAPVFATLELRYPRD